MTIDYSDAVEYVNRSSFVIDWDMHEIAYEIYEG